MNELQSDRWDRFLRRLFDIRAGAVAGTVAPEITPILAIEPEDRPENEFLRDHRLFWLSLHVEMVEFQYAVILLANKSTDRLVILECYTCAGDAVCTVLDPYHCGLWEADLAATGTPQARDSRYVSPFPISAGMFYTGTTLKSPEPGHTVYSGVDGPISGIPVVLEPGAGLLTQATLVGTAHDGNFAWRERDYEISEVPIRQPDPEPE